MIATTSRSFSRFWWIHSIVALLASAIATGVSAERLAQARFKTVPTLEDWSFQVTYPEAVTRADQVSASRREGEHWVLRLGTAPSVTLFESVDLSAVTQPVVSWVMRVEHARWNDDAFFEVRGRTPDGAEIPLKRWDAAALRAAKPGRGNFELAALPEDLKSVEIVVAAQASAERGSAWIDLFDVRVDGTNRIPLPGEPPRPPEWERPPYLQQVGRDRALLRWRSRTPRNAIVRWSPATSEASEAQRWGGTGATTEGAVRLHSLRPDTLYRYAIELDGQVMTEEATHSFRTAPPVDADSAIGLWVIGDSGDCSARPAGCERAARVRDAFATVSTGRPPALWLLLGDNAYPHGTDWQYTDALFRLYARQAATTPLWPVPGNHDFYAADSLDQSGAYFDAFSLPTGAELGGVASGTEAFYSFDWGPLHVVALDSHDSNRGPDAPMATWLEADLRAARQARWKIAMFHHPPYSRGSHDSDDPDDSTGRMIEMRRVFLPILERHGVDLVLAGHSHGYERSGLIGGHYGDANSFQAPVHRVATGKGTMSEPYQKRRGPEAPGTVYAVVGSASDVSRRMKVHPVMEKSLASLGSLWIEIEGEVLRGRFVDAEAQVLDDFAIRKEGDVPGPLHPALLAAGAMVLMLGAFAALRAGRRIRP